MTSINTISYQTALENLQQINAHWETKLSDLQESIKQNPTNIKYREELRACQYEYEQFVKTMAQLIAAIAAQQSQQST